MHSRARWLRSTSVFLLLCGLPVTSAPAYAQGKPTPSNLTSRFAVPEKITPSLVLSSRQTTPRTATTKSHKTLTWILVGAAAGGVGAALALRGSGGGATEQQQGPSGTITIGTPSVGAP